MTATAPDWRGAVDGGELARFDARDYRLMVTMHATSREVRIEHQAGDDAQAAADMARLAAEIIEQLGPGPVVRALQDLGGVAALDVDERALVAHAVPAPRRGTAVLVCSCGNAIDRADMRFARPLVGRRRGGASRVPVVCCPRCAQL